MIVIMLVCVKGEYSTAGVAGRPPGTVTRCQPSQIPSGSNVTWIANHYNNRQTTRAIKSQCANHQTTDLSGQSQYFSPRRLLRVAIIGGSGNPCWRLVKRTNLCSGLMWWWMPAAVCITSTTQSNNVFFGRTTRMWCGCEVMGIKTPQRLQRLTLLNSKKMQDCRIF